MGFVWVNPAGTCRAGSVGLQRGVLNSRAWLLSAQMDGHKLQGQKQEPWPLLRSPSRTWKERASRLSKEWPTPQVQKRGSNWAKIWSEMVIFCKQSGLTWLKKKKSFFLTMLQIKCKLQLGSFPRLGFKKKSTFVLYSIITFFNILLKEPGVWNPGMCFSAGSSRDCAAGGRVFQRSCQHR